MQNNIPMPAIFTIGETVYDIIFEHSMPRVAKAGGSMLNTAVSLGRCGMKVEMITELGTDRVGQLVLDFLNENGVSTSFIQPSAGFKTPVSLAFLDEQGNAQYSFYKHYPEDRLNFAWPEAAREDVVLFGSFYSLDQAIRARIIAFVRNAKQNGALIIYDPNIRKNHLGEIRKLMRLVDENIAMADIVRGSDEDFENLYGYDDGEKVFDQVRAAGCMNLIYTGSDKGADLFSDRLKVHVPAKKVQVVSTIGAGDAFNAGIIFGLVSRGLTGYNLRQLSRDAWKELIGFGVTFASEVCRSFDNYISAESGRMAHG